MCDIEGGQLIQKRHVFDAVVSWLETQVSNEQDSSRKSAPMTLSELAAKFLDAFVQKETSSFRGEYWVIKMGHPLEDRAVGLMAHVHPTNHPDDFRYDFAIDSLRKIMEHPDLSVDEIRSMIKPDHQAKLLEWLDWDVKNVNYVDDFRQKNPDPEHSRSVMDDIRGGQLTQKLEVFDSVVEWLKAQPEVKQGLDRE